MRVIFQTGARGATVVGVALCILLGSVAQAQSADAVKADELFRSGKERLAEKDYARACPLFADSFRVDAAIGTLLALAICHEREGKLASAYREYAEVVARSAGGDARADREKAARERMTALVNRLSTLTISIVEVGRVEALEVRINGSVVDPAQLGKAIPVDGGKQTIEAWAKDKRTWRTEVAMAASIDAKTVVIPALEQAPAKFRQVAAAARPVQRLRGTRPPRSDRSRRHSFSPWWGITTLGVGLAGVSVGTYFTISAIRKNQDSNAGCDGDLCTGDARQERLDARHAGNLATVAFVAGGVLATIGVVLLIVSGHSARADRAADRAALAGAPWIGPRAAGATLRGSF